VCILYEIFNSKLSVVAISTLRTDDVPASDTAYFENNIQHLNATTNAKYDMKQAPHILLDEETGSITLTPAGRIDAHHRSTTQSQSVF
jgi:hypothetical protein